MGGVCFAGAQFLLANYHGPTLPDIGSAIATIVGLVLLLKVWKPSRTFRFEGEPESNLSGSRLSGFGCARAWGPYIVLAVFVFFWGLPQFKGYPERRSRREISASAGPACMGKS